MAVYQSYPPSLWAPPAPPPAPVVGSLNPATVQGGGSAFALRVIGSNFLNTDVIVINDVEYPTAFQSATELVTNVTVPSIDPPGSAPQVVPVLVRRGETESNSVDFTVTSAPAEEPSEAPDSTPEAQRAPESPTDPVEEG